MGSYRDAILVTTPLPAPFDQLEVPVSLIIADQGAIMSLSQNGVRFATTQGNQSSRSSADLCREFRLSGSAVNWTAQAVRGADLVTLLNPRRRTSTPGQSFGIRDSFERYRGQLARRQVCADPGYRSAVPKLAAIRRRSGGCRANRHGAGSRSRSGRLGLPRVPRALRRPPAQQVTVNTTSRDPVAFSVSTLTDDGANWLSAKADAGVTSDETRRRSMSRSIPAR